LLGVIITGQAGWSAATGGGLARRLGTLDRSGSVGARIPDHLGGFAETLAGRRRRRLGRPCHDEGWLPQVREHTVGALTREREGRGHACVPWAAE